MGVAVSGAVAVVDPAAGERTAGKHERTNRRARRRASKLIEKLAARLGYARDCLRTTRAAVAELHTENVRLRTELRLVDLERNQAATELERERRERARLEDRLSEQQALLESTERDKEATEDALGEALRARDKAESERERLAAEFEALGEKLEGEP